MALWVREYAGAGYPGRTDVPVPLETGDNAQTLSQTVVNDVTSVQSADFASTTRIVGLQSDATVWVEFSPKDDPVAVSGKGIRLIANQPAVHVGVRGGKLAVINE